MSLPSFRRAGCLWKVSGCLFCASRGFSSPSARLDTAGGVGESLVAHSVRVSSLLSPRFIRGLGRLELLSCGECLLLYMSVWLSLLISVHLTRCWGGRVVRSVRLCSRLSLPSYLCTLDKVVRRVRFSSAAPVSFPPWPPNLRLERQGGSLSPLLVEWLSLAVLLLALSLRLLFSVKRTRRCEPGTFR